MITSDRIVFSPAQEQASWQYKAILATRGNQTLLGAILLQLLGKQAKHPPQILSTATVDEQGLAWCKLRKELGGEIAEGIICVGLITDVRDEFRRLADYLKLDDDERIELFNELRMWVEIDLRADHNELKDAGKSTLH